MTLAERCHQVQLLTATMERDLFTAIEAACGTLATGDDEGIRTDQYDNSIELWGVPDIDLAIAAAKLKACGFERVWLHQHISRGDCKCRVW